MINEIDLVPQSETIQKKPLQIASSSQNKEALIITLPVEKRLTVPQKEFPVSKWTMPAEPHGYIKGNDNDCL
jgi:hypothetical protein